MTITLENIEILTTKGFELGGLIFKPIVENNNKNLILIGSATGIKYTYYKKLANYFVEKGFQVLLFDYSGIGQSLYKPIRKIKTNMEDWGKIDLQAVINWIKNNFTYEEFYYIGHSVGGQLVGLLDDPNIFDKLIFVTSQNGYWRYYTKKKYLYAIAYRTVWPFLTWLFGYLPSKRMIGENLPKGVALQWVSWLKSKNYLFDHINSKGYELLTKPLLAFSFTDDHYAPPPAVENLMTHYTNTQLTLKSYKPEDLGRKKIGHFGFFREENKDTLWKEVLDFFSN
ncbi:MAG: hypothetical protein HeimC3_09570 [Candidatus Heimdallarchaeota archaeon LC_3]|nr:MAG: hypothetical protein HeimC3_09570 [Candidatus Heimdallarchaeota archaeon LC_3]